jgi:hypothetical protein
LLVFEQGVKSETDRQTTRKHKNKLKKKNGQEQVKNSTYLDLSNLVNVKQKKTTKFDIEK